MCGPISSFPTDHRTAYFSPNGGTKKKALVYVDSYREWMAYHFGYRSELMEYYESDGITGTELEDSLRIRNYPPFPNSGKIDNKDLDYILN